MQKQKQRIDSQIEKNSLEKGVMIFLTGDGKGKTSSAFGMVLRALGYNHKVGVVQFIKGQQLSGEELYLKNTLPDVQFYQLGTGFTWDTQDRSSDIEAAEKTWSVAQRMLKDKTLDLVILDEDPLTNIRNTNSVNMVMKNGRLYNGDNLDQIYPLNKKSTNFTWQEEGPISLPGIKN